MMSNRCHLLNRPYDGRVFQEVFNITDMRMCACMFKKEMGSRIAENNQSILKYFSPMRERNIFKLCKKEDIAEMYDKTIWALAKE